MTHKLIKLEICSVTVATDGTVHPDSSKTFSVMLNPNQLSHTCSISYNKTKTLGQLASALKFSAINPGDISFELLLDNTGVVKGSSDVQTQLENLSGIVYKYDGDNHEPNHVRVLWGGLLFYGRLTSLSVDYTLFSPDGIPLRAKIKMSFKGFMSTQEQAKRANKSSPDMTHIVVFKAGDSLPLLCHRIYDDVTCFDTVARINHITNFRDIRPGSRILFPPLR
ncbi:MAG: peptidoglycan-binding protein [Desulfatitalea sp.]|nr:hypothetical protein [Desulfatitalea sp.]NNK00617.1 peptidoglycan-binding protein [Desulfatitalea sp.]